MTELFDESNFGRCALEPVEYLIPLFIGRGKPINNLSPFKNKSDEKYKLLNFLNLSKRCLGSM